MSLNATRKEKDDVKGRSPVGFAALWLGLPIVLVVVTVLYMKFF